MLLLRGLVTMEAIDGVPDEYLAASRKSLPPARVGAFEAAVRSMYRQMVRISIEPMWARFYDFGAGRLPGFLTDLSGGR